MAVAGCSPQSAPTSTTAAQTTTSFAPIEIDVVSTTLPEGVEPEVYQSLSAEVARLADATQLLRGLSYIQVPDVAFVQQDEYATRLAEWSTPDLDLIAGTEPMMRLLGQYDSPPPLRRAVSELYAPQRSVAFYDGAMAQVVIVADRSEWSPSEASSVVRVLASALIDQYHDVSDQLADLMSSRDLDGYDALATLAEGDALAVQLRYVQSLDPDAQAEIAREVRDASPDVLARLPDAVVAQLALPGTVGVPFVDQVVADGGYAALDAAYDPPPTSMEQVLHVDRFAVREPERQIPDLDLELDGYRLVASGGYGEWRLDALLAEAVEPGRATQAAAGWGGDTYHLLRNGDDVLFIYQYGADTVGDAIEVAQALVALARGPMAAGDGVDDGGGILWQGLGTYAFVDRIGDGLVFVAATDDAAGAAARAAVRVP